MARGNRDVSLVIRAKNEASRTLDAITASLASLRSEQSGLEQSGEKANNTLAQLGAEINKLRQVASGSTLDKLADSMQKAASAVANLEQATVKTREEQAGLQAELQKTEATTARLAQRQTQLTGRLAQQRDSVARAKQSFSELTVELARSERFLSGSGDALEKLSARMGRQQAAVDKTAARYEFLSAEISKASEPSKRLTDQLARAEERLTKQRATLDGTKAKYSEYAAEVERTAAALPKLRQSQSQSEAAFRRAEAAQSRTVRALGHVSAAQREVDASTRRTQTAIERNAATYDRQTASLTRTRDEFKELEASSTQAGVALERVGNTVRQRLLTQLREGQQELRKYSAEWKAAQQGIQQAVAGGARTAAPTPELQRQLDTARQQKAAYDAMRVAVHQYRMAIREAGGDVTKLAAAQQQYQAALERIRATTTATARDVVATSRQQVQAQRQNTREIERTATAMTALERRGRAAMTWAQRLRGEVIALTLSYVGLYAGIEQLRGVTSAFMELEAAQNRMLVAFGGDEFVAGREMRWVREQADLLGIQFGVLAQEYSKFAIAARGSAVEGAEARRVFEAVTVAARVNKLTIDQMEGTFLALSQMMSKGVVSMEELRRQMGDRLYGAFTLAAESMGITTAELDKLVSTGSLFTDRFLPRFADRLEEVFGPHLSQSLDTFTTDLGRFQNEIFKTQLRIAEAGFVDGLRDALTSLSDFFQSDEGIRFFESLGAAAGNLVRFLAQIPRHLDGILLVFSALVALRVAAWAQTLGLRFREAVVATRPLPAVMKATAASATSAAAGMTAAGRGASGAAAGFVSLGSAMRGAQALMTSTHARAVALTRVMHGLRAALAMIGGLPGLIITGVSLALTSWLTNGEKVVNVTAQHETQLLSLIDDYSRVAESAMTWGEALEQGLNKVTLDQARKNFTDQINQMGRDMANAFANVQMPFTVGSYRHNLQEIEREVIELTNRLRAGDITAKTFQLALNTILQDDRVTPRLRKVIEANSEFTQALVDSEARAVQAAGMVKDLGGEIDELPPILRDAVQGLLEFAQAAGALGEGTTLDPYDRLNQAIEQLKREIPSMAAEMRKLDQIKAIDDIVASTEEMTKGVDRASEAWQTFLKLAAQAKAEIAAGTGRAGGRDSSAEYVRNLNRQLSRQAQDLSYGGQLPQDVFVARAIEDEQSNARRAKVRLTQAQLAQIEANAIAEWGRAAAEYNAQLERSLTRREQDLVHTQGLTREMTIQRALEDEMMRARAANAELTAEQRDRVAATAALAWEQTEAERVLREETEKRQAAEARINNLVQLRRDLMEQVTFLQSQGDSEGAERLKQQINGVTEDLKAAIDAQIAYWQAAQGGPDGEMADAAIARLQVLRNSLFETGQLALLTAHNLGQTFGEHIQAGLQNFTNQFRETGDLLGSLRDSFIQFASDFLLRIAQMIIQQRLFNALQSLGAGGGFWGGVLAGVSHAGGVAGSSNRSRRVSPGIFANAVRYHNGGIAGLRPNEVPAILERGEEILTTSDPRHRNNGNGAQPEAAQPSRFRFVLVDDRAGLQDWMRSAEGEQVFVEMLRRNSSVLRGV